MSQIPAKKFEAILRLVLSHLVAANVHLTIWEELRSTPDREKLCNTYRGFFYWTRDAHVDRFIHKICVVTDSDKPESTEGGRRVSVLKRQEGAPVLLG